MSQPPHKYSTQLLLLLLWHPTPVLLPGKSHAWRSLVGCSPWGREELDTTERLHFHFSLSCIGEGNGNPLQCSCLEIPEMGEPGGLPSMGSHRVGHDWSNLAVATPCIVFYIKTQFFSLIELITIVALLLFFKSPPLVGCKFWKQWDHYFSVHNFISSAYLAQYMTQSKH